MIKNLSISLMGKIVFCTFFLGMVNYGHALNSGEKNSDSTTSYVQIVLDKDNEGFFTPKLVDSKGKKGDLTLGSLINKVVELKPSTKEEVDNQARINANSDFKAAKIMREQTGNNEIKIIVIGPRGKTREELTFGSLLIVTSRLSALASNTTIKKEIADNLGVQIKEDSQGKLEASVIDAQGNNQKLNLATILRALSLDLMGTKNQ